MSEYSTSELEKIKQEAYESGLKDAWKAVRKIVMSPDDGGMNFEDLIAIFGIGRSYQILRDFSVSEAIKKIKEYEQGKDKISVGDVLIHKRDKEALVVVTEIKSSGFFNGIKISEKNSCGNLFSYYSGRDIKDWKKTGQHYDLKNIFHV